MNYLHHFGINPYDLDYGLGLVESACDEYGIDWDVFMDELFEDVIETGFTDDFTNTIIELAFIKLKGLLDGHKVWYETNGRASGLAIDGKAIYC